MSVPDEFEEINEPLPPPTPLDKEFKETYNKTHVSNEDFEAHKKDFNFHKRILDWTFAFVVAVLVICFVTFMAYMLDAWKLHSEREKEYMETVKELKHKNDNKIRRLAHKVNLLETQNEVFTNRLDSCLKAKRRNNAPKK